MNQFKPFDRRALDNIKGVKKVADELRSTPSKGQPSVDEILVRIIDLNLAPKGLTEAKAQLLEIALSCLPEKYKLHPKGHKYRAKLTASLVADNIWTEGFNAALDLMEQSLRKGYE